MKPRMPQQLIPPFRYAMVEEGFSRGAYPTLKNFRFLRRLGLKTIISLTPEPHPNRDMLQFCRHEGIVSKHLYVEKYQHDGVTLSYATLLQIVPLLIHPDHLPVYLHCLDGTNVTGLVVMCFRKLQTWHLPSSAHEFCSFQREGELSNEECDFVEGFRGEIDIPHCIPKWLWQGIRTIRHPTLKLRLLPPPPPPPETGTHSGIPKSGTTPTDPPSSSLTPTASTPPPPPAPTPLPPPHPHPIPPLSHVPGHASTGTGSSEGVVERVRVPGG